MVKRSFSTSWKRSTQVRKQRKYKYNAPLHIKQKMMHVHLSSELRGKYGLRNIQIRKNDTIKVLRGKFKKKEGKVEHVDLKREKVQITGLEYIKKDGTKVLATFVPSNLMILNLDLSDKKRKMKLKKQEDQKVEPKATKTGVEAKK